jgi:chloride channel 2
MSDKNPWNRLEDTDEELGDHDANPHQDQQLEPHHSDAEVQHNHEFSNGANHPEIDSGGESGLESGLDEAISEGDEYEDQQLPSNNSLINRMQPPSDMPSSLASIFGSGPSSLFAPPSDQPKRPEKPEPPRIFEDMDDQVSSDSPRSNNSSDYLQTMDSRAEFDLRRFGTVPRLDMQTLEENQQGQYGAEENHDNQRNLLNLSDSGSDIQPPESADPNQPPEKGDYGYEQTIFGHFKSTLQSQAAEIAKELKRKKKKATKRRTIVYPPDTPRRKIRYVFSRFLNLLSEANISIVFLVILGVIAALVGVAMDTFITYILDLRSFLLSLTGDFYLRYFIWVSHMLTFLGLSLFFTQVISANAAGSGIPEMKCVLSGVTLGQYLSLKTLLSKILGLSTAIGCGLFVGKEGPFVHTSSIIANQLSKLKFFRKIKKNPSLKQQMYAAAAACGVASNFGSPIGGVLFSIEVTSTYYPLRNYWFAFVAATTGGTLFKILTNQIAGYPLLRAYLPTDYDDVIAKANFWEFLVFIAMGVAGGALSACFIFVNSKWIKFRRAYATTYPLLNPYPYTFVAGIVTAIITFPGAIDDPIGLGSFAALKDLYQGSPLVPYPPGKLNTDWSDISVYFSLIMFMVFRMVLLILALSMPLPLGVVIPVLVIGASFGRMVGEAVNFGSGGNSLSPGIYAIVGTAAIGSGITHTLSMSVIMFEITGQLNFALPVILVVVIAQGVSQKLSVSIFDSISLIRGLPFLPDLGLGTVSKTARDIMEPRVENFLTMKTSLRDMKQFLQRWATTDNFRTYSIPIVDSPENKTLVGTTNYEALLGFVTSLQYEINKEKENRQAKLDALIAQGRSTAEFLDKQRKKKFDIRHKLKQIIQGAPIQFQPDTPLSQVHLFFITLRLQNAFVTKNGKLAGMISRDALQKAISFGNETVFQHV